MHIVGICVQLRTRTDVKCQHANVLKGKQVFGIAAMINKHRVVNLLKCIAGGLSLEIYKVKVCNKRTVWNLRGLALDLISASRQIT